MHDKKAHFSTLLGCEDERDKDINFSTAAMVMGLDLKNSILFEDGLHDDYFKSIIEVATSLQKANSHYRKYIKLEKVFIKDYEEKCLGRGQNSNSSTVALELVTEIDGVLSNYKSCLDSLAKTFRPMFGLSIGSWAKAKDIDGIEKSGIRLLNTLEKNLPRDVLKKTEQLRKYIKTNIDWVTFLVSMRDDVHHGGGIKGITNVVI